MDKEGERASERAIIRSTHERMDVTVLLSMDVTVLLSMPYLPAKKKIQEKIYQLLVHGSAYVRV